MIFVAVVIIVVVVVEYIILKYVHVFFSIEK
jgi:hypothetical protein